MIPNYFRGLLLILSVLLMNLACNRQQPAANRQDDQQKPAVKADSNNPQSSSKPGKAKLRQFQFVYAGMVNELTPGTKARIWLPLAQDTHEQTVKVEKIDLPAPHQQTVEKKHGNRLLYFEAVANDDGEIPFSVTYLVKRRESLKSQAESAAQDKQQDFLAPSSLVPTDRDLISELLPGKKPTGKPVDIARQLYEAVDQRMKYDKPDGVPWGRGDSVWACQAGTGNCTDFHSLFISVCRESNIAARFEIGFPIPDKRGEGEVAGYHCWAKFVGDGRWLPVDISEADKHPEMKTYYFGNLTENRVSFSIGRDLQLAPVQDSGPVNFLVYPHVEVDGKRHTSFVKKFRYRDVDVVAEKSP